MITISSNFGFILKIYIDIWIAQLFFSFHGFILAVNYKLSHDFICMCQLLAQVPPEKSNFIHTKYLLNKVYRTLTNYISIFSCPSKFNTLSGSLMILSNHIFYVNFDFSISM